MTCRCDAVTELSGNEAIQYAREHLQQVRIDAARWETEYVCPLTRLRWIEDYPHSELHGGGAPRLRRVNA